MFELNILGERFDNRATRVELFIGCVKLAETNRLAMLFAYVIC